jgi:hypothetical protein
VCQGRTIGSNSDEKAVEGKNRTQREALRPENRMEKNENNAIFSKKNRTRKQENRKKTDASATPRPIFRTASQALVFVCV